MRRYLFLAVVYFLMLKDSVLCSSSSHPPHHTSDSIYLKINVWGYCACGHGNGDSLTYISRNLGWCALYATGTRVSLSDCVLGLGLGHIICWPALLIFLPKSIVDFPGMVWLDWKLLVLAIGSWAMPNFGALFMGWAWVTSINMALELSLMTLPGKIYCHLHHNGLFALTVVELWFKIVAIANTKLLIMQNYASNISNCQIEWIGHICQYFQYNASE